MSPWRSLLGQLYLFPMFKSLQLIWRYQSQILHLLVPILGINLRTWQRREGARSISSTSAKATMRHFLLAYYMEKILIKIFSTGERCRWHIIVMASQITGNSTVFIRLSRLITMGTPKLRFTSPLWENHWWQVESLQKPDRTESVSCQNVIMAFRENMYVIVQGIFLMICCLYQCFYALPNLGLSFPSKIFFLNKTLCIVIFHRRIIDFLFYCIFLTVPCGQIARDSNMYTCWRNIMTTVPSAKQPIHTVYPKKYAHGFVVLCFVVVMQSFIMNSHEVFIHIHQGCFAGTAAIVRLPPCQWSKPGGYGKISQCITTTKHSKAKTVCIFLGIYCSSH